MWGICIIGVEGVKGCEGVMGRGGANLGEEGVKLGAVKGGAGCGVVK